MLLVGFLEVITIEESRINIPQDKTNILFSGTVEVVKTVIMDQVVGKHRHNTFTGESNQICSKIGPSHPKVFAVGSPTEALKGHIHNLVTKRRLMSRSPNFEAASTRTCLYRYVTKSCGMGYCIEIKMEKPAGWNSAFCDLQFCFGVKGFLVIASQSTNGVFLDALKASKLLSAVTTALLNCSSLRPTFVPVHDPS
ncbi:hypothetical protein VNO77_14122 [Canavalia gladiata]|uniref:Uncharacterized protein n=1 Tax=Canavalia gladiata TaxID=3824 RepID=A0AAN9QQU7_CANGL